MKKENGISLIVVVVIISVIIIVGCAIAGIIIGMNKINNNTTTENKVSNIVDSKDNTVVQKNEAKNNEISSTQTKEELVFTEDYLKNGKTSGNVEIIKNSVDKLIILSITGNSDNDAADSSLVSTKNRWYVSLNLDNYSTLEFYARKGHDNGDLLVGIDSRIIKRVRFNEFASTWTKYQIDVSKYTGNHTIVFAGGYADRSGSEESNTQYCNIKLKP